MTHREAVIVLFLALMVCLWIIDVPEIIRQSRRDRRNGR